MAKPPFHPGQKAPVSGLYPLQGPRGGNQGVQVTVVQGRPLPPTPEPGMGYGKPEPAKHER
jgi:hypothetical protein